MFFLSLENEMLPTQQHPAWEDLADFRVLVHFHVVVGEVEVSLRSLSIRVRGVALQLTKVREVFEGLVVGAS